MQEYIDKYLNDYLVICGNEISTKIFICKQYLYETDYTIIKMYEEVVRGGSIENMKEEYKEVLINRDEARQLINELEI